MTPHLGDLLSALVDGQLSGEEADAARSHLDACPACAAELDATIRMRALVRALEPVDPLRPLVAVPPAPGRVGRMAGLVATAAAAVSMLVLSGLEQETRSVPQVASLVQVHATAPVNADPMGQLVPSAIPLSLER
jgi:anti-sigma factor RsiW